MQAALESSAAAAAAVLRLIGMLFVSKGTAHPLEWRFSRLYLCVLSLAFFCLCVFLASADVEGLELRHYLTMTSK